MTELDFNVLEFTFRGTMGVQKLDEGRPIHQVEPYFIRPGIADFKDQVVEARGGLQQLYDCVQACTPKHCAGVMQI